MVDRLTITITMTKKELFLKVFTLPSVNYWNYDVALESVLSIHKDFFISMIQHRINHCENQLKAHLHEAKATLERQIIVWEGGHFAVPVWTELNKALNQEPIEWTALVWEQIIRQMGREKEPFDAVLWDIASEGCMCCNKQINPEPFNF